MYRLLIFHKLKPKAHHMIQTTFKCEAQLHTSNSKTLQYTVTIMQP